VPAQVSNPFQKDAQVSAQMTRFYMPAQVSPQSMEFSISVFVRSCKIQQHANEALFLKRLLLIVTRIIYFYCQQWAMVTPNN
jgi:hypothetical protein